MDLDNEGSPADLEGNYIDDDVFGLNIKKESEELRQQELLIEEEVRDVRLHFLALAKKATVSINYQPPCAFSRSSASSTSP